MTCSPFQIRPYPVSIEAGRVHSCPWLIKDGEVNCARRAPAKVLYSFSASPNGTSRLRAFIHLPEQYPALNLLAECLESLRMVDEHVTDPQPNQISDVVRARTKAPGRSLRPLDQGEGKERLLPTLVQETVGHKTRLNYSAFDTIRYRCWQRAMHSAQ